MGLDMYIRRVTKVVGLEKLKSIQDIDDNDLNRISKEDYDSNPEFFEDLFPYMRKVNVEAQVLDIECIKKEYDLKDCDFGYFGSAGMSLTGIKKDGEQIDITIGPVDIGKYYVNKKIDVYVFHDEGVFYWRKNYDLQEKIYDIIMRPIDNCQYRKLTFDELRDIITDKDSGYDVKLLDELDPTDAYFYEEWY